MQNFDIVGALAFFTIGIVLVFGVISWIRASKAQKEHKDAAVAQRQRKADATFSRSESELDNRGDTTGDQSAASGSGRSWSHDRGANPPTAPVTPPD